MYKYSYDSSSESSDNESHSRDSAATLDFSYQNLNSEDLVKNLEKMEIKFGKQQEAINTLLPAYNFIDVIDANVSKFNSLKTLDLSNNHITSLPEAISQFPLTTLIVKNNRLTNSGLPKSLKNLRSLKMCNFSGNRLSKFPNQLLEIKSLEYLYLGSNRIKELPNEIEVLKKYVVLL